MSYNTILYETAGHVLTLTLNRPTKLNAFTAEMGDELADAFERADRDDHVRAIIVTGAGRAFCAGADISAGAGSFDVTGDAGAANFGGERRIFDPIFNCRKPSIAAFNGAAVGIGITLALPIDIKIAADTARFGFVFTRRGLPPEAASAWFLPKLVGLSQSLRWMLTGNIFDAQEALRGGLVSEVVPAGELMARARQIAEEIAAHTAPVATALTRQLLWRFAGADSPNELATIDRQLAKERGASGDVREGVTAFLEKRAPDFPDRVSDGMPPTYPWWRE